MTEPRQCPATSKRTGEQCKRFLGAGQKVCKWHGGAAPQVLAVANRRADLERLSGELVRLGVPIETDPGDALLAMVCEAAGNVAYLRARVAELGEYELTGIVKADAYGGEQSGPHVLVVMYDAERDRLANIAALALRAGVDERRVRLAEADAERVFAAVNGALSAAGLTPTQQEAFRLALAAALRSG